MNKKMTQAETNKFNFKRFLTGWFKPGDFAFTINDVTWLFNTGMSNYCLTKEAVHDVIEELRAEDWIKPDTARLREII